ncbi:hypothetical protein BDV26DRAFT_280616 [Aspergillus bertholletiae]|uniref:Protein kinase domain-containing protein n=1 Tax=Aspergillus bertholletiae TaxID=1226010 RepID=A0A5N7BB23_9EURO|nr:hypothetical protein BDV26DRAFT_280616 [Aspergillus bertholletiae]
MYTTFQQQFPSVHWIRKGGISFVYEVHSHIVVKVPKSRDFEREQFHKERKIYELFSQSPPCPSRTMVVTKVEKLEPLRLQKEWMNDLAKAIAFLESLNLAHGDLRPENILLDGDRLKLSDFDCAEEIGTEFEACVASYERLLNSNEAGQGRRGTSGLLGPRKDEHGPKVVDMLQNMEFPQLELAAHTESLLVEGTNGRGNDNVINHREPNRGSCDIDREHRAEDFSSAKAICQDLENRGLLCLLSSMNLGDLDPL